MFPIQMYKDKPRSETTGETVGKHALELGSYVGGFMCNAWRTPEKRSRYCTYPPMKVEIEVDRIIS